MVTLGVPANPSTCWRLANTAAAGTVDMNNPTNHSLILFFSPSPLYLATHVQGIGVRSTRYQLNDAFPYQSIAFNLHIVVRSGQVCRYLVAEALLTSIYLVPEEKTFI